MRRMFKAAKPGREVELFRVGLDDGPLVMGNNDEVVIVGLVHRFGPHEMRFE